MAVHEPVLMSVSFTCGMSFQCQFQVKMNGGGMIGVSAVEVARRIQKRRLLPHSSHTARARHNDDIATLLSRHELWREYSDLPSHPASGVRGLLVRFAGLE